MRFLTLNTHSWCEIHQIAKIRTLAKFIIEHQVDVIALQEVNQLTSTPRGEGAPQLPWRRRRAGPRRQLRPAARAGTQRNGRNLRVDPHRATSVGTATTNA